MISEKMIAGSALSVFHPYQSAVDGIRADPTVHVAFVVRNLEPSAMDRSDKVKILSAIHLAQDDITFPESGRIDRGHRTQLP